MLPVSHPTLSGYGQPPPRFSGAPDAAAGFGQPGSAYMAPPIVGPPKRLIATCDGMLDAVQAGITCRLTVRYRNVA